MDITNINLGACPLQYLSIGYVGEAGARPVAFDFSDWATEYGSGVLQLLLQRPGDADPYPVVLDIDGTTATWTPDATATEKTGQGQAQLVYTVGGVVVKNAIFRVLIAPSLGAAGDPPEPYEDWLERLLTIAAEAQQSALDAAESAAEAEQSAGDAAAAKTAAETAQTGAEAAKSGAEAAEQTAQQAAALARAKAAQAAEAAQIAGREADYAMHQSVAAGDSAAAAHDDAERAAQSAEDAQAAASAAQTAASAAAASASAAAGSAADAAAAVTEVETKGAEQITAIDQAGATQIAAVDAAGAAQVQAIEDKGEEVIASIPSDYTELADEVSDLKSSLSDESDSIRGEISQVVTMGCSFYGRYNVGVDNLLHKQNARAASRNLIYTQGDVIRSVSDDIVFKVCEYKDNIYTYLTDDFVSTFTVNESSQILRVIVAKTDLSNFSSDSVAKTAISNILIDYHFYRDSPVIGTGWEMTSNGKLALNVVDGTEGFMVTVINDAKVGDAIIFPSDYDAYISILDDTGYRYAGSDLINPKPVAYNGIIIASIRNRPSSVPLTNYQIQYILKNIKIISHGDNMPVVGIGDKPTLGGDYSVMSAYRMSVVQNLNNNIQALAVYGNTLYQLYDAGLCAVYDLHTNDLLSQYTLDGMTASDHCGNASFGNLFFDSADTYPALYASGNLSTYQCKVERVTQTGSTLKQIIDFSSLTTGNFGGNAVAVDNVNNEIVYMQRTGTYGNNALKISFFDVPALTDGVPNADNIPVVAYTATDVKRTLTLAQSIINYQDATVVGNKIYILGGPNPTTINVFDLSTGERLSYIDISDAVMALEPEGIDVYKNTLIISTVRCGIYQIFF